jgi:hypothetical protein
MRKIFRVRNFVLLICILYVGSAVVGTYWQNYVCGPGDHVIQSEADAIKQGKSVYFRAIYEHHGVAGYPDTQPELVNWGSTDNCCRATRDGLEWDVSLHGVTEGEDRPRRVTA